MEEKREWGRPRKNNSKDHLPNVVISKSIIEDIEKIANRYPGVPLSHFYEMALTDYIKRHKTPERISL